MYKNDKIEEKTTSKILSKKFSSTVIESVA